MDNLCIGLIGAILIFLFGHLLYGDIIPKDIGHPIHQERISMSRTGPILDWWESIGLEEE